MQKCYQMEVIELNFLVSYVFIIFLQGEIWQFHILIGSKRSRIHFTAVPEIHHNKTFFSLNDTTEQTES